MSQHTTSRFPSVPRGRRRVRPSSRAVPALGLAALAALAACGGDGAARDRGGAGPVVRDSAGVTIVESPAPAWGETAGWRVAPEPVVSIGAVEGPESQRLGRVTGAVRLAHGDIVVADHLAHALRFYDAAGAHRFDVGGEGEGPGEFRDIASLQLVGDSLVALDFLAGRFSVFDTTGAFRSARPLDFAAMPHGYLADGSLIVEAMDAGNALESEARRLDMRSAILRYRPGADEPDTLGVFPGLQLFRQADAGGGPMPPALVHFGRTPMVAVARDRVYFGDRVSAIRVLRPGAPPRLIRWGEPPAEATRDHVEKLIESSLDGTEDAARRAAARSRLLDVPHGPTLPAYTDLRVDGQGHLWVRAWVPPWEADAPGRREVFDSTGAWLGPVAVPAGLDVTHIDAGHITGVELDAYDVPHVRVYRLDRTVTGQ